MAGMFWEAKKLRPCPKEYYSNSKNNVPFQPQYNSDFIGKNSQIKPRKSEQGGGIKMMLGKMIAINNFDYLNAVRFNAL